MTENANDIHDFISEVTNFYPSLVQEAKATNKRDNINISRLQ